MKTLKRIVGVLLVILYAWWGVAGHDRLHDNMARMEGLAVAAYLPTAVQPVAPYGAFVSASSTAPGATATFPVGIVGEPSADPCLSRQIVKVPFAINISSSATASLATAGLTQRVTLCGIAFTANNNSVTLVQASPGAGCPGATPISGAMAVASAEPFSAGWSGNMAQLNPGNQLCAWPQGTAISVQGIGSYVSQ